MNSRTSGLSVGLALGGGGARGLAHIGVLQVLEKQDIPLHLVVGTSIGALVGAMYAVDPNAEKLRQTALQYLDSPEFMDWHDNITNVYPKKDSEKLFDKFSNYAKQFLLARKAIVSNSLFERGLLEKAINYLLDDVKIENCALLFTAVTADLDTGESIRIAKGSLRHAVLISSSIPGIFPPVELEGHMLIDGGAVSMVPVDEARFQGAEFVIAVDVSRDIKRSFPMDNGLEIAHRADDVTNYCLRQLQLKNADVVISPEVSDFHWSQFQQAEKIIEAGRTAAENAIEEIVDGLKRKQRWRLFTRWNPFSSKPIKLR